MTTLDKIFNDRKEPVAVFTALLLAMGKALQCDRTFLSVASCSIDAI